jgi:hypothetical protein
MGEIFQITVSSNYAELWRYNIAVVAACFDKDHNQMEVVAERSHLADVGANLRMAESGWMERHKLSLKTPACESIECLVYLIPHTLPAVREIEDASPFQIKIVVKRGAKTLHEELHQVNQWSGASIELKF